MELRSIVGLLLGCDGGIVEGTNEGDILGLFDGLMLGLEVGSGLKPRRDGKNLDAKNRGKSQRKKLKRRIENR
jgi:hypothetical protein